MMKKLKGIKTKVEYLFIEEPKTREDDKFLILRYIQRYHNAKRLKDITNKELLEDCYVTRTIKCFNKTRFK